MTVKRFLSLGPMGWLGLLFIASATLRIGAGVPAVWAAAEPEPAVVAETPPKADCPTEADLQILLDTLRAREAKVAASETDIAERLAAVSEREAEAEARLMAATAAEEDLKETMALSNSASETDLQQLTDVYEKMKPKKAALLFEAMDPAFAAGFLARMKPATAAMVFAALPPDHAHAISVVLAGRNALAVVSEAPEDAVE